MNPLRVLAALVLCGSAAFGQPNNPGSTSIYDSLTLKEKHPPTRITVGEGKTKRVIALGKRYALVVGVAKVECPGVECEPLPESNTDSSMLAERLEKCGYAVTLLNETEGATVPTKDAVVDALHTVCENAGENDQVLVYASTHGGVFNGKPLIMMKDAILFVDDIKKELAASKALVRVIMLDACRDQPGFPTQTSEYRDIHTILSCRPDEKSLSVKGGMSVFTSVLIDALDGCHADRVKDGQIELDEILYYIDENVPILAEQVAPGHRQNPTRSVVDPRSVNPIISSCSILDQLLLPENEVPKDVAPVAVEGAVGRGPRNDLILSASIAGKLNIGMTPWRVVEQLGEPVDPIALDKDGRDLLMFMNKPEQGDTTFVFFDKGELNHVMVMFKKVCDGEFSAAASRDALTKLLAGKPLDALSDILKGQETKDIFSALGCPTGALSAEVRGGLEIYTYDNVPLDGQELVIKCHNGVFESAEAKAMPTK